MRLNSTFLTIIILIGLSRAHKKFKRNTIREEKGISKGNSKGKSISAFRFKQSPLKLKSLFSNLRVSKQIHKGRIHDFHHNFRFKEAGSINIPKSSVISKSWMKYIKVDVENPRKFSNFFFNEAYTKTEQLEPATGIEDEFGPIDVPSPVHFFMVLTHDAFYILSARRNEIAKTVDVIHISTLYPQLTCDNGVYKGGIEDMGGYKEGCCFKLHQRGADGEIQWIFCSDNDDSKSKMMDTIAQLKTQQQPAMINNNGNAQTIETEATLGPGQGLNPSQYSTQYSEIGPDGKPIYQDPNSSLNANGKWINLQNWSTCTLACGGGTQTLHRLCVPPTGTGKDCEGPPIVTRPCNMQPCPDSITQETHEVLPTKVKMMKISKRPQRYETCVMKEGDLDVIQEQLVQFKRKPRIPSRVVMNNRTISVFESDHYDTVMFSAILKNVVLVENHPDDPDACFIVKDLVSLKRVSLCSLENAVEGPRVIKDDWIDKIIFFRDKCFAKLKIAPQDSDNDPLVNLKKEELKEAEAEASKERLEDDTANNGNSDKLGKYLKSVQSLAVDAIQKEIRYENMQENELRKKEQDEKRAMKLKIEQMKEREECINRELEKKDRKSDIQMREKDVLDKINELKNDIKLIITRKRADHSKKIEMMKKLAERRKHQDAQLLTELQMRVAKDMLRAEKKGDPTQCDPSLSNSVSIKSYCGLNFHDEPNLYKDCLDPECFCYMCCETELGVIYGVSRDKCFDKCDNKAKVPTGKWIWVPHSNRVGDEKI